MRPGGWHDAAGLRSLGSGPPTLHHVVMARCKLIRVQLVSGLGRRLDPSPARLLVVPRRIPYAQLAVAINGAFARWDLDKPWTFTLPDRSTVVHSLDAAAPQPGALPPATSIGPLSDHQEFVFDYDPERGWHHACQVLMTRESLQEWGRDITEPTVIDGWGPVPDPFGRDDQLDRIARLAPEDDGPVTVRLDLGAVRTATTPADLVAAIGSDDLTFALQQVGLRVLAMWLDEREAGAEVLGDLMSRLIPQAQERRWHGDDELAELLTLVRDGGALPEGAVAVDLVEVAQAPGGEREGGAHVNRHTGEVVPASLTDPVMTIDDELVDVDGPDWVTVEPDGRSDYRDMEVFAAWVEDEDPRSADLLRRALHGRGAFRRFRDELHQQGEWVERWRCFVEDRKLGRARRALTREGVTPLPCRAGAAAARSRKPERP